MNNLKHTKMSIFKFVLVVFCLTFSTQSFSQTKEPAVSESKKPLKETKYTEVVNTDSMPASELLKRAVNWVKLENDKYEKDNGVTTATKAECTAKFKVKPKELNPQCDYTGTFSMKIVVECKDNKYRYTVSQIKHLSKTGKATAGSIDNIVPECGSFIMEDMVWKKLKGEGIKCANILINDLKEEMKKDSKGAGDEW